MATIKITLSKSPIGRLPVQRKTVKALGLGKIGSSVVKEDTPAVRGMAASIQHLVTIEGAAVAAKPKVKKAAAPKAEKAANSKTTTSHRGRPASGKPTAANKVAEIKAYLDAHKIDYPSTAKKPDLLALIK